MALYGTSRDVSLFRHINRELIHDIITQQCVFYQLKAAETKVNIYGEPKPIEPEPVVKINQDVEIEKQNILNEINRIQNSGVSGRKAGPAIEQLQNRLQDLDNTIIY